MSNPITLKPGKYIKGTINALNHDLVVIDFDRLGSSSPNKYPYNSKFATANAIVNTIPAPIKRGNTSIILASMMIVFKIFV